MKVTAAIILLVALWCWSTAPAYGEHKGIEVEVGDTVIVPVVCVKLQPVLYMYSNLLQSREFNITDSIATSCVYVGAHSLVVTSVVLAGADHDQDDIYTVQLEGPTKLKIYAVVYVTNLVKKGSKNGRKSSFD